MDSKIELVIFDWAGTVVDYGSQAPVDVFVRTFEKKDIPVTKEEINEFMGMEKKGHIRSILTLDRVSDLFQTVYQRSWTEDDVEEMFQIFEADLKTVVVEYSKPIDHAIEAVDELRKMGLKIGSCTGYVSDIMKGVVVKAKENGYEADCLITPDLIEGMGRPTPFMVYECMRRMSVYPASKVVKVGDTVMDILEGKNAGTKTVGILTGSNILGLTKVEYEAMDAEKLAALKASATETYLQAGADFVIDNLSELPELITKLNQD